MMKWIQCNKEKYLYALRVRDGSKGNWGFNEMFHFYSMFETEQKRTAMEDTLSTSLQVPDTFAAIHSFSKHIVVTY